MISLKSNSGRSSALRAAPQGSKKGSLTVASRSESPPATKLDLLKIHAARIFDLTPRQLEDSSHTRRYAEARHAFYLVARTTTDFPLMAIGACVRRWDHKTVTNGICRAQQVMARDSNYRSKVEQLMECAG